MSTLSFAELAELGSRQDVEFELSQDGNGGYQSPLKPNHSYVVEITQAAYKESKNGFHQLELTLAGVRVDGSTLNIGKRWVLLPVLSDAQRAQKGTESSDKFIRNTAHSLHAILQAVSPKEFGVADHIDKSTKPWRYLDEDGTEIDELTRKQRQVTIGHAVLGVAAALVQGAAEPVEFVGTRLVMVEVPSKKSDQVFVNFYHKAPEKTPVGEL